MLGRHIVVLLHIVTRADIALVKHKRLEAFHHLIVIGHPEISVMLVLFLLDSPVPVSVRGKLIVIGAPAVPDQPGSVFRRLVLLVKILPGIVIVPTHNTDGMRITICALVGILRKVRTEVFPLLCRPVRSRALCLKAERDAAVCQQLLLDRSSSQRIVGIAFPVLIICRRGQNIGVLQPVRLIEPVFLGNLPIVVFTVTKPSPAGLFFTVLIVPVDEPALCLAVSSLIDQHFFIALVQPASVLQVRAYTRRVQPGHVSRVPALHLLCSGQRNRPPLPLAVLRILRVIQCSECKERQVLLRQVESLCRITVILRQPAAENADLRRGSRAMDPAGSERILEPDRRNDPGSLDLNVAKIKFCRHLPVRCRCVQIPLLKVKHIILHFHLCRDFLPGSFLSGILLYSSLFSHRFLHRILLSGFLLQTALRGLRGRCRRSASGHCQYNAHGEACCCILNLSVKHVLSPFR